jgi:hypothetical protein
MASAGVGYLRCLRRQDHEKPTDAVGWRDDRSGVSDGGHDGPGVGHGCGPAGRNDSDGPDGLAGEVHMPDRFRLTGRGESHRLSRWAGRLSWPAPSIPVSHDSTEGADPGVSLLLQPSWLPGLPGRVGHLHPHLAGRLSCALSRNLTGSWPRRGDPAAGCPGPQTLISVLVTQNRYPDSPACDARGRRETMTTSTGPLAACRRRRLRPEPGRLAQHGGQPARLGRACGSGY